MNRITTRQAANFMNLKNSKLIDETKFKIGKRKHIIGATSQNKGCIFAHDNSRRDYSNAFLMDFDINSNCYNRFGLNSFTATASIYNNSIARELLINKSALENASELNGVKVQTLMAKDNVLKINSEGLYRINMSNGKKRILTSKKNGSSFNLFYQPIGEMRGVDIYDYESRSGFFQKNKAYYIEACDVPLYSKDDVRLATRYKSLIKDLVRGFGLRGQDIGPELERKENKEILESLGFDLKSGSITVMVGNEGRTYHFDENERYLYSEEAKPQGR